MSTIRAAAGEEYPEIIPDEETLDEIMTRPRAPLVELVSRLAGPLVILGASGKMGPSLAVMARRAAEMAGRDLEIIAVARFSDPDARRWLEERGVRTLACDLLDDAQVSALPDAPDVIYMAGRKFGTTDDPPLTWAMNLLPPVAVTRRYAGSRIVALSTGCVYPLVPVAGGGSREPEDLTPVGEYANACVARERIFEYEGRLRTTPICLIRLNYALDLRYGVLVDIGGKVLRGEPVDLSMGYLNCIWQRDANEIILRALEVAAVPALPLNVTGPRIERARDLATRLGAHLGREPIFTGEEGSHALLSDPARMVELFGEPAVELDTVIRWTAAWLRGQGRTLGKPTHYEASDGRY